ncbi:MAG: tetratricopeptide repeat protein, partial [Steroidobacteraceae bacterium]
SAAAPRAALSPNEIGALVALVERERLSEAEQQARALLTVHPDAGMLWKILGVALLRQGKDPLPAMRRTVQLLPQDAEAYGNLGLALHDRGQWAEALMSLERALELRPNDEQALLAAADAMKALGRARDSVPLYQRALGLNPRLPEAHNNLGNAFLELGRHGDAAACYRLALEIRPDDAQIHCNLGNAQRQLGLLDQALASTRRAMALDPSLSVAPNNLGLILAAQGRHEEATAGFRQALELNARYVEALNNLGNVLRDTGELREAASLYRRAIELDPARAETHCNLGNALLEARRIEEAVVSYHRAVAVDPRSALAHVSLATALRLQARWSDAESSCRAALALEPANAEALSLLGELRADQGRFSEAEELFRRAIAADSDFPFAFCSIAAHRRMSAADAAWLDGAQSLLAKRPPLRNAVNLHFALGKYFDDVERYDEAFAHYLQAHELAKRYGWKYDADKQARRVDRLISIFDAQFVRAAAARGSPSELPVFVIGMPRSGTSLAEQILASHPAVFGAGEVVFWDAAFSAKEAAGLEGEAGARGLSSMAGDYLEHIRTLSGGAVRVVDKNPANFLHAGLIQAALPDARIIHMRRHPLDTCLSIYFQNFFNMGAYANDLDDLADYYAQYLRITAHWRATLPPTRLLEVPYEGLIENQEGWTRRMLDFIGVPWNPRCLDFHETDRVVITASKWQVRQKIHGRSAGRFRNYERFLGPLRKLVEWPAPGT